MCIRDREYFDKPDATAATVDADGWLHTGDLGTMDARGYCPVSYTHLRAHETVLDLVCRLLLEIKNTMYSNTTYSHIIANKNNKLIKLYEHDYANNT